MPHARAPDSLPLLLLAVTVLTGMLDAAGYLALGEVFVANMTGNVVFLGLSLGAPSREALLPSFLALAAFCCGALLGGRVGRRAAGQADRCRLLAGCIAIEAGAVAAVAILVHVFGVHRPWAPPLLIVMLALTVGGQNAVVLRMRVQDLTTTVVTVTITRLMGEAGSLPSQQAWRAGSVAALVCGAFAGGLLIARTSLETLLWLTGTGLGLCSVAAYLASRR
ncbi:YoaK family protein [Actinomadura craniellae]|nr:YoaK family protein [Actinomadura craniellae]